MLPAVALIGRPNVGKSTLFNRLTHSRDALVADFPGLTRDRRYGFGEHDGRRFIVVDTGGLTSDLAESMAALVAEQVEIAIEEANAIVLIVDYKTGLTEEDRRIAERLRVCDKPVFVAVNKAEGVLGEIAEAEFHGLGLGEPQGITALHGQGVPGLLERVLAPFPAPAPAADDADADAAAPADADVAADADADADAAADAGRTPRLPKVAVIGRPNVGKSTLINRLVGSNRLITSAEPGTTRDSVLVPCERDGREFLLIDTAGIRRRARVSEAVEKFSIVQSLQAVEDAGAVIALLDAREGVTDQDLHLIGSAAERGRALVVGVNKWDGLASGDRRQVEREIDRRLDFVPYASVHYISALHGSGIAELIATALRAYRDAGADFTTPRLNRLLKDAVQANPPPMVRGRAVRLRYAHQGGKYPPIVVVHGNQAERLPAHYKRYLENAFRKALRLRGTPLRIELRTGENPFAGKRNVLTPRQAKSRRRLLRHQKKRR
jgi:GTP-binding protein